MKKSAFAKMLFSIALISLVSCQKEENPVVQSTPKTTEPKIDVSHLSTEDIGRVLFYDVQLSVNNSTSCASCHKQRLAFADDVAFSKGFDNRKTLRNSIAIQNLSAFQKNLGGGLNQGKQVLFWDGRETELESMVLKPLANHIEMGMAGLDELEAKVNKIGYYKRFFKHYFEKDYITADLIATCLSSFVQSIESHSTKFDQDFEKLTAQESFGQSLFFTKYPCNSCHQLNIPNGYLQGGTDQTPFANIGLEMLSEDQGLAGITGKSEDRGKFKVPSLRNVALTAPYMHDGRFKTLQEVLDHYSMHMQPSKSLDDRLIGPDGSPLRMNISPTEKEAMVAFLHTLTDMNTISDTRYSDPFIQQ